MHAASDHHPRNRARFTSQLGALLVVVLLTGAAARAEAQGDLRLHLETGLIGYESVSTEGPGGEVEGDSTRIGLYPNNFGFGLGFLLNYDLMLGLTTYVYMEDDGGRDNTFRLRLLPYLEFLFSAGGTRPFIGLTAGIDRNDPGGDGGDQTRFIVGGMGGLHIMLGGSSIDLGARLHWETWSAGPVDYDLVGFTVLFGISAWN